MSITELTQSNISKLTLEDLSRINQECKNFKVKFEKEKNETLKNIRIIDSNLKVVSTEIKRREELESSKNIVDENIRKIENFSLLKSV